MAIVYFGLLSMLFLGLIGVSLFFPYLPSISEKLFFSIYFPAVLALLSVSFCFLHKRRGKSLIIKIANGDAGDKFVGLPGILKYLSLVVLMSFLIGSSSQGIVVLPTLLFGSPAISKEIVMVSNINGFRTDYNNTVWVSFGKGFFARRFLWNKRNLKIKNIAVGSCVQVVGKTLGAGTEVNDILKVTSNGSPLCPVGQ